MKTLRIELSCFIADKDTNDKIINAVYFYKNKNKTVLQSLDRHRAKQFDEALTLIVNKDYATILDLVLRDLQDQFDQVEVIEKIINP